MLSNDGHSYIPIKELSKQEVLYIIINVIAYCIIYPKIKIGCREIRRPIFSILTII